MRKFALKIHRILSGQMGIDPIRFFRSIRGLPYFLSDWFIFRRNYFGRLTFSPYLHDRFLEGGFTKSEYFWQDLLVAQWIYKNNPLKHVDVGSRVDGFIAHVASFRQIEVIDVRPISASIPGVTFSQGDLMKESPLSKDLKGVGYCDSLSCLHALEHFGLGRYGDPIDILGPEKGLANMVKLLKKSGTFYLSLPIGQERVEFNANKVFDPKYIIKISKENGLLLTSITIINSDGLVGEIDPNKENLDKLSRDYYNLGIFVFTKE